MSARFACSSRSTFRDMQRERDELVKRTFPRLRALCEQRGVVWTDVNLRWGISDERQAEGGVLPVCIEEIRRCRPYFIGLLGERYGWVPDGIPAGLLAQEPWLADQSGSSVTELEILEGVLNDPGRAQCAFFYFRDPLAVDGIPAAERADFVEEPPARTSRHTAPATHGSAPLIGGGGWPRSRTGSARVAFTCGKDSRTRRNSANLSTVISRRSSVSASPKTAGRHLISESARLMTPSPRTGHATTLAAATPWRCSKGTRRAAIRRSR